MAEFNLGKGFGYKPCTITENGVTIGKKEYPIEEITSVTSAFNATALTNGVITFVINGKAVSYGYPKKETDEAKKAVEFLQDIIEKREAEQDVPLETAEDLYKYCKDHNYGEGFNEKWALKHFQVIVDMLDKDEKVLFPFIGLHNYESTKKHDGNYAYVVTNKRIIMAQQKLVGSNVKTVNWNNINDITFDKGTLIGVITIDTFKEVFNVGVNRISAQSIFERLHKELDVIHKKTNQPVQQTVVQESQKDPVQQVRELKSLLDDGIITQEEFDKKKKELLGL